MQLSRRTSLFLTLVLVADGLFAQSNTLDPTFNPTDAGFGRNDGMRIANAVNPQFVNHAALMADGRMVIVGGFDIHDGRFRGNITRALQDGSIDTTFVPAATGVVERVLVQADGKVIIGGNFSTVGGVSRRGIARLNTNGSLDTSFDPGIGFQNGTANGTVEHMVLQPDGKVIVAGSFTTYNGVSVSRPVRLNTDGTVDATLNTGAGFGNTINGLALQPDGKILVVGAFTSYNGTSRPAIARLQSTGALDGSFAPTFAGGNSGQTLALRADGKVWLNGNFTSVNGQPRQKFVLLTASGATDPGFVPAALTYVRVTSLAAQADGKLLVGMYLNNSTGAARDHLARFNADGSIDPVFAGTDFNDNVSHLVLLPDQRIVVFGNFLSYGQHGECTFTRLMPDGTVDPTWGQANAFDFTALNIVTQPDGKHVVVGGFLSYFNHTANRVARLHPNGELDTGFNAWWGINSLVRDVVLQPDGKLLIGGHFVDVADATYSGRVMRLNSDGSYDPTFVADWNQISTIRRLALQPDGKVLAMSGGGLNRLLPNGDLDPSFTPGLSPGALYDVLALPSGEILVAGGTNLYNGQTVGAIFRLNNDGSVDTGFNIGAGPNNNSSIQDIERQPDGKILAAGNSFTTFNGQARSRLVRLNTDGSVDLSFNIGTGFDGSTALVKVAPSGKIYVSGEFQNVNGITRPRLARLLPNGTLDASYDLGTGPQSTLNGMVISATEDHVIVGGFRQIDGIGRNRIARIKDTPRMAARIMLEGPYNGSTMNDALRILPSFPPTEPFTAMGYAHATYTSGAMIPTGILTGTGNFTVVDWVIVEMRPVTSPGTVAASRAALLLRNGWVVDLDGMGYVGFAGLAAGNYCVAVRSRNHLPVMSAPSNPIAYGGSIATINFTLPATPVYDDDARKNVSGVMVLTAGDVTFNGTVQYSGSGNDRDPILSRIGGIIPTNSVSGYWPEDVNMDGVVLYTGSGNDRDLILQSIGGIVPTNTRSASLP
ncbi:MAG: delta-60 repeat domain-containing protein [Flavobacteriales bacterium]|nr:delta-60 repeat domain-containing protein [Flavobacteriales bacterium]